jgi:hypothetical protein
MRRGPFEMQRFYIIYINQFDFVWKSRVRKQIVQTKGTEAHTNAPRLGSQNHRSLRISIPAFATLKIGLFSSPCGRGVEQSRQRSPVQASGIFQLPTNSSQLQAGKQIIKSKRKEKKRKENSSRQLKFLQRSSRRLTRGAGGHRKPPRSVDPGERR